MEENQLAATSLGVLRQGQDSSRNPGPDPALLALLECPVCYSYMSPPTFQCPAGHTVCSRCKARVRQCPVCRGEMKNYRNLTLEKLSEIIALPCAYRDNGCPEIRLSKDRKSHEHFCPFRTCACPSLDDSCQWEGVCQQVVPHLTENHPRIKHLNHDAVRLALVGLEETRPLTWVARLRCYQRDFLIQIIKTEKVDENSPLHIIIRNVGSRRESGYFRGRIEIKGRGKHMSWESITRSISGDLKFLVRMRDCMTLSIQMLERMLENQVLTVIITILPTRNRQTVETPEAVSEEAVQVE
ncbi:E3 ubiquitin-protein ligase Siah1-like [Centruroides vittatus]|uniref:E3 ubiquitin-protein ligase Siah1-like n=1 Tax=Centruroides vittatus TaxID=120091 RepID=UPI00351072DA